MEQKEQTLEIIKNIYCSELLSKIADYWKSINDGKSNKTRTIQKNGKIPWFGDISFAWNEIRNKSKKKVFKRFPKNIQEHVTELSEELQWILPEEVLVKDFLPVLLNSYFVNRSKQRTLYSSLKDQVCSVSMIERNICILETEERNKMTVFILQN